MITYLDIYTFSSKSLVGGKFFQNFNLFNSSVELLVV